MNFENMIANIRQITSDNRLIADCKVTDANLNADCLPQVVRRGWKSNMQNEGNYKCDYVEERFVLFIQRDGSTNFFHSLMDHIMAFHTLLVLGITHKDVVIVLTDMDRNHPTVGTYGPLWSAISNYPALMAKEYTNEGAILMKKGAFSSTGGCSLGWLSRNQYGPWSCPGMTTLVSSFARNILSTFDFINIPPPNKPTILFISRKVFCSIFFNPGIYFLIRSLSP